MKVYILIILFGLLSCTPSDESPKEVLVKFVNLRFSNNQSLEKIKSYLGPDLSGQLEKLTQEQIDNYIGLNKRKLMKIKINAETCDGVKCLLTYTITYEEKMDKNDQVSVETKKIAELQKLDGNWKIINIDEVKSYLNYKEPI